MPILSILHATKTVTRRNPNTTTMKMFNTHPYGVDFDNDQTTLERTVSKMYGELSEEDRSELKRIASSLHQSRTHQSRDGSYLERQDTLAGVTDDDPRLDPSLPEFDIHV